MIYGCHKEWKSSYIQKYTGKRGTPLPEKTVASFSRQILEGMMFLERKGWPYQVASCGNVLLHKNQSHCMLADVESALLDIPPRIAPLVPPGHDAAIISFGHAVYEMACGVELDTQDLPANIPCAQSIIKLLRLIWTKPDISLEELSTNPLFAGVALKDETSAVKYSPSQAPLCTAFM